MLILILFYLSLIVWLSSHNWLGSNIYLGIRLDANMLVGLLLIYLLFMPKQCLMLSEEDFYYGYEAKFNVQINHNQLQLNILGQLRVTSFYFSFFIFNRYLYLSYLISFLTLILWLNLPPLNLSFNHHHQNLNLIFH